MIEKLEVDLKMRTPLWTGDVDRTCHWIRETSLIGSLRWWYDALLRGYGAEIPHLREDDTCECKEGHWEEICPTCQLFGCTGWSRRFKLKSSIAYPEKVFFAATDRGYSATGNWLWRIFGGTDTGGKKSGRGRDSDFKFGVEQLWANQLKLTFASGYPEAKKAIAKLAYLLHIIIDHASIGPKPQHGFGQFEFDKNILSSILQLGKNLVIKEAKKKESRSESSNNGFKPDFKRFFCVTMGIPEFNFRRGWKIIGQTPQQYKKEYIPAAFSLRYRESFFGTGLRIYFKERLDNKNKIHDLMGNSRPNIDDEQRSASRIFVGHPYRHNGLYQVKIFGFVPQDLKSGHRDVDPATVARWTEDCIKNKLFQEAKVIKRIFWRDIKDENL